MQHLSNFEILSLVVAGVALAISVSVAVYLHIMFVREVRQRFDEMLTVLRQNLTTEVQTGGLVVEGFRDLRSFISSMPNQRGGS